MSLRGSPFNFLTNTELGATVIETITERKLLEVGLAALTGGTFAAAFIENKLGGIDKVPDATKQFVLGVVGNLEQDVGAPIFQSFIQTALNVRLSDTTGQEAAAVRMIERAIGFGAGVPLVIGPVSGWLETKFGHHAPKELFKALKDIPHDIGMSFFLGTTLASIFETATQGPIGEAIREQTRPSRLEWSQINRLLRMHEITDAEANDRIAKAGFRSEDIDILKRLERQLLTVSDAQLLSDIGYYDTATFTDYLRKLGHSDEDINALLAITHHKASTEGSTSMRTVARNAFLDSYLSEDTYRAILQSVETPTESIDLLVEGVKLERDAGKLHLSVAEIKDLYQHGHLTTGEVRQRLGNLGFNDADTADLMVVWQDQQKVARSGIGTNKVLGYLLGGVITKEQAYKRLITNGMSQADAQFLVDNPSTHPNVATKQVSPATIVAAYKDDVLTIDEARALLKSINASAVDIELLLANATAIITKGKKPKKPTKTLSEGNVLEALKLGLAEPTWAERELETLGWAASDATLLTMIELTKLDSKAPAKYGWQVLT